MADGPVPDQEQKAAFAAAVENSVAFWKIRPVPGIDTNRIETFNSGKVIQQSLAVTAYGQREGEKLSQEEFVAPKAICHGSVGGRTDNSRRFLEVVEREVRKYSLTGEYAHEQQAVALEAAAGQLAQELGGDHVLAMAEKDPQTGEVYIYIAGGVPQDRAAKGETPSLAYFHVDGQTGECQRVEYASQTKRARFKVNLNDEGEHGFVLLPRDSETSLPLLKLRVEVAKRGGKVNFSVLGESLKGRGGQEVFVVGNSGAGFERHADGREGIGSTLERPKEKTPEQDLVRRRGTFGVKPVQPTAAPPAGAEGAGEQRREQSGGYVGVLEERDVGAIGGVFAGAQVGVRGPDKVGDGVKKVSAGLQVDFFSKVIGQEEVVDQSSGVIFAPLQHRCSVFWRGLTTEADCRRLT